MDNQITNSSKDAHVRVVDLRQMHERVSNSLFSGQLLPNTELKILLKRYCDIIPRLTKLCNEFTLPTEEDYFPSKDNFKSDLDKLYLSVSDLAHSSLNDKSDLVAESHLRIAIEVLNSILCEDFVQTRTATSTESRWKFPVEDPDAADCKSYGRIIFWLKLLKCNYPFDGSAYKTYRNNVTQTEIERFFLIAVSRNQPKNGVDLIKTILFIFSEVIWYLETVRVRLAPLHNLVVFPGVHQ